VTVRQLLVLLALATVWGASFLFIRVLLLAGIEPVGVSAARSTLGVISLLPVAYLARKQFPRDRRSILLVCGIGIANFAFPWSLWAYAQQFVPSGVGSIANSAQPLWSAIFATLLIKSALPGRVGIFGLLLGFGGVVALMAGGLQHLGPDSLKGIPLMFVATICYGFSVVALGRWVSHVRPIPLTFIQMGVASSILFPIALGTGAYNDAVMGWQEWASALAIGGVGSGVAIVMFMWLVSEIGPVRASAVTYLMPPIGVLLGWLLLDESLGWAVLIGLVLIITGVALVQGVPVARVIAYIRPSRSLA
jgi:drug/metabolite transporter (DMT)-like permease